MQKDETVRSVCGVGRFITPNVIVMMRLNEMGEHHAEVVDVGDLRAFNEACDWVDSRMTHLIRIDRKDYSALVYAECGVGGLTFYQSELIYEDAQYEIEKMLSKTAKAS